MKTMASILIILSALVVSTLCSAEPAQTAPPAPATITTPNNAASGATVGVDDWGLGFGLGVEQYNDPYIQEASLRGDTRIVTTEKTFETRPSAWLTINWNIWGVGTGKTTLSGQTVKDARWGFFAGVKIIDSNSDAFSAFSLGPQVSFVLAKKTISIGAGWVTHQTRKYANGIVAGQPLPAQYDDIVFEEGTENSYMLMMSIGL